MYIIYDDSIIIIGFNLTTTYTINDIILVVSQTFFSHAQPRHIVSIEAFCTI